MTASDVLVLVGDPGRMARQSGGAEGLLALRGAPVRAADLGVVTERDVAPTVLHLAGLPTSRELAGRVLEDALSPAFRATHPRRTVASYGRRAPGRPAESAFDRDMLEQLRSLGYVQ
jgi:arylsulfatase A-like enzyme